MLDWKRPLRALEAVAPALFAGGSVQAYFVGDGPLLGKFRETVYRCELGACVKALGAVPNNKVRELTRESHIFLASSNFREGWGAVVNEAMASGLAVCASRSMGCVPYLIQGGKNGYAFDVEDFAGMGNMILKLAANPRQAEVIGTEASKTMITTWNAQVAAERLLELAEWLRAGNEGSPFAEGPCSMADVVHGGRFFNG